VGNCHGQGAYIMEGLGGPLPGCDHGVNIENPPCVCVLLYFMTQYWEIVTVPGFVHERAKGVHTHDSESPMYLLNLSPSNNLGCQVLHLNLGRQTLHLMG